MGCHFSFHLRNSLCQSFSEIRSLLNKGRERTRKALQWEVPVFMACCGNPLPNTVMNRVTKKCTEQIIPVFTQYAQWSPIKQSGLNQARIPPLPHSQGVWGRKRKEPGDALCLLPSWPLPPSCRMRAGATREPRGAQGCRQGGPSCASASAQRRSTSSPPSPPLT